MISTIIYPLFCSHIPQKPNLLRGRFGMITTLLQCNFFTGAAILHSKQELSLPVKIDNTVLKFVFEYVLTASSNKNQCKSSVCSAFTASLIQVLKYNAFSSYFILNRLMQSQLAKLVDKLHIHGAKSDLSGEETVLVLVIYRLFRVSYCRLSELFSV